MEEMYFNVIKDTGDSSKPEYLFNPIHIDGEKYVIQSVKTPDDSFLNEDWMRDNPLIKQITLLLPLIKDFPGREVMDMKIKVNDSEYLIYSIDYSLKEFSCYGVTITKALKESMPVTRELEYSSRVYNEFKKILTGEEDLGNVLKKVFSDFRSNFELSSAFDRVKQNKKAGDYSLEKISFEKVYPKLDASLMKISGEPCLDTYIRYQPERNIFDPHPDFFTLDNKRVYKIPGFESGEELKKIHFHNCAALAVSNIRCNLLGETIGKEVQLEQITTKLHNNYGVGFTLLKPVSIGKEKCIAFMDVKNSVIYKGEYVKCLKGTEKVILDLFADKLSKNYKKFYDGACFDEEVIFDYFEESVKEAENL